jgi:hypothetical protein
LMLRWCTFSGWCREHHQQKTFPSRRNGCIRVDVLHQSHGRHPGGGIRQARSQYHASPCISPSDRCFPVFSLSVSLLFKTNTQALWPTVTIRRNGFMWVLSCIGIAMQWVTLRKSPLTFYLHQARGAYPPVMIHAIARIHEIAQRQSETKSWER